MQVRPLRRWRFDQNGTVLEDGSGDPMYGNQSYLTHGNNFFIYRPSDCNYWAINAWQADTTHWEEVDKAGLFTAQFPRLRDAVHALEAVLKGIEQ